MTYRKCRYWLGALGVSLSVALPIQAAVVDFEDVPAGLNSIYEHGQTFSSGGFKFGVTSFANAPVPGSLYGQVGDAASVLVLAPPANSSGQFYQGYNDGGVTLTTHNDLWLTISSLDAAFMVFAPGFYSPGDTPAQLMAHYVNGAGIAGVESWSLGAADANGEFAFNTITGLALGAVGGPLKSVTFSACVDSGTGCINPTAFGDAWFGLDNIVAVIPEPASVALLALALAAAGAASRRRRVSV